MESMDYELMQALIYMRSCGFSFALFLMGVGSAVAAVRLKKVVGLWIFSVCAFLFLGIETLVTGLVIARLDVPRIAHAFSSSVTLLSTVGMLVGVAMIKPPPRASEGEEAS